MKEGVQMNSNAKRLFFFWAGIIATVAYRAIIFTNALWSDILWYAGTLGFILYFGHRAQVQKKRANMVKRNNLIKLVHEMKGLKKGQKESLIYLVETAVTSKSRINSLFIFWLSILATIVGIIFDFIL